jgi:hypothetical protein
MVQWSNEGKLAMMAISCHVLRQPEDHSACMSSGMDGQAGGMGLSNIGKYQSSSPVAER